MIPIVLPDGRRFALFGNIRNITQIAQIANCALTEKFAYAELRLSGNKKDSTLRCAALGSGKGRSSGAVPLNTFVPARQARERSWEDDQNGR